MGITINGSSAAGNIDLGTNGTITDLAVGGLPDGTVDTDTLASGTAGNLKVTIATEAGALSGATNYDFTLPANCFRVDFVGQEISTSGSGDPAFRLGTSAGILSSSNSDWTQDMVSHEYESDENEIHAFDPNLNASGDTGDLYVTFLKTSAADKWVYRGVGNRRSQDENMYFIGFPDLGGNALTTIRFFPNGTGFDTGRFSWTAYSTV